MPTATKQDDMDMGDTVLYIFRKKAGASSSSSSSSERKKERNQICDEQVDMHNNKVLPDTNRIDLINDTIAFAITFLHV